MRADLGARDAGAQEGGCIRAGEAGGGVVMRACACTGFVALNRGRALNACARGVHGAGSGHGGLGRAMRLPCAPAPARFANAEFGFVQLSPSPRTPAPRASPKMMVVNCTIPATFGCYAILGAPRTQSSSSVVGQKAGPCSRHRRFAFCLVFSLITKARREATRARNKPKKRQRLLLFSLKPWWRDRRHALRFCSQQGDCTVLCPRQTTKDGMSWVDRGSSYDGDHTTRGRCAFASRP